MRNNLKIIFALTLVHFTGDFYSAFTTPAFTDKLNLTPAQVGFIAGINRFLSFIPLLTLPPILFFPKQRSEM